MKSSTPAPKPYPPDDYQNRKPRKALDNIQHARELHSQVEDSACASGSWSSGPDAGCSSMNIGASIIRIGFGGDIKLFL